MELYIDASGRNKIVVKLDDHIFEDERKKENSQKLLPLVREALKKEKLSFKDIDSIRVNTGPGSYTGLRVGVSVAQGLGWLLGVPVNGKDIGKGEKIKIEYD